MPDDNEFPDPDEYARSIGAMSGDDLLREVSMNLMAMRAELTYLRQLVQATVGEGPDRLVVNVYDHGRDELPN